MTIQPIVTQYQKEDDYVPYYSFIYPNETGTPVEYHIKTQCDRPVWFTINPDTIHGTIVVNKQKYNISFYFDPDDPKDVSTIEGTSPLRYKIPETNADRPIFLDVNQSNARLVLTKPCDWSNLFITYSMDTDYWFHDFNISHFKQFLYEFERVRLTFTNIE